MRCLSGASGLATRGFGSSGVGRQPGRWQASVSTVRPAVRFTTLHSSALDRSTSALHLTATVDGNTGERRRIYAGKGALPCQG